MLNAINTKILLAILAALTAIGGAVIYQRHEAAESRRSRSQRQRQSFSNSKRRPRSRRSEMKHSGQQVEAEQETAQLRRRP